MSLSEMFFSKDWLFSGSCPWTEGAQLQLDSLILGQIVEEIANVVFAPFSLGLILIRDPEKILERAFCWKTNPRSGRMWDEVIGGEDGISEVSWDVMVRWEGSLDEYMRVFWNHLSSGASLSQGWAIAFKELEKEIGKRLHIEPIQARDRVIEFLQRISEGLPWVLPMDGVSFLRLNRKEKGWISLSVLLQRGHLIEAWTRQGRREERDESLSRLEERGSRISLGVTVELDWVDSMAPSYSLNDLLLKAYQNKTLILDPASPGLHMALGALRVAQALGFFVKK